MRAYADVVMPTPGVSSGLRNRSEEGKRSILVFVKYFDEQEKHEQRGENKPRAEDRGPDRGTTDHS